MSIEQIFVEQAEYLEEEAFQKWNAEHPDEVSILRKIMQGGAKLISGPRGCGKTTLLLKAFHKMIGADDAAFPVYVNYKRSLSIEPIYKAGTDGTYWFNQWVILKIYLGIYESLERLGTTVDLSIPKAQAKIAASKLEMSNASGVSIHELSVPLLEADLLRVMEKVNRTRCVLLLDDAAHAFSPDQQHDFFDFFRQIKSRYISPKAAVYPGVTNYSSSFHVGHDAEEVDVWIKPERAEYLKFMRRVIETRLPADAMRATGGNDDTTDFLCYAAFGVPRALLNMLQALTNEQDGDEPVLNLSKTEVIKAVKQHYQGTTRLFTSLAAKLAIYRNFINTGEVILATAIDFIKKYNKGKAVDRQSVSIAISQEDYSHEFARVFGLFQYAGLCIPREEMSNRGEQGRYHIFVMHYAGIIDANALLGSRSVSLANYVHALSARNPREYSRVRASALLGHVLPDVAFKLSLPPCPACQTPRISEDARFCAKCGTPLTSGSTYLDLVNRDIDELPLTDARIAKIKEQSTIRKVKDILMDHEHRKLLGVDRIGKFWAAKIVRLAEEFVE